MEKQKSKLNKITIGIIAEENTLVSPVNGVIKTFFPTKHAEIKYFIAFLLIQNVFY